MLKFSDFNKIYSSRLGLIRSLLALSHLLTLLLNSTEDLFPYFIWKNIKENPLHFVQKLDIFFLGTNYSSVQIFHWIGIIILILVIIGYLPQITCILHAWVAYSIFYGAVITEGGDQISSIITILLIPICFFDKRLNHWFDNKVFFKYNTNRYVEYFFYCSFCVIQFQVAFVYLHAAIGKCVLPYWYNGSILYYWCNDPLLGATEPILSFINFIFRSGLITFLVTWSVLILEFFLGAALLMNDYQKRLLFKAGIVFHLLIFLIHGLASFGLAMTVCLFLLLEPYKKGKIKKEIIES